MKVLIVEDSKTQAKWLIEEFKQRGHESESRDTIQAALLCLIYKNKYDIVVCDYHLLGTEGDECVKIVGKFHPIVLSVSTDPKEPHTFHKGDMGAIIDEAERLVAAYKKDNNEIHRTG